VGKTKRRMFKPKFAKKFAVKYAKFKEELALRTAKEEETIQEQPTSEIEKSTITELVSEESPKIVIKNKTTKPRKKKPRQFKKKTTAKED
jgi:hypothetical protein